MSYADIIHSSQQYEYGEENYITKYIVVNKQETYDIILQNNCKYSINLNNFNSYQRSSYKKTR
jgi:hypothetical protein